MNIIKLKPVDCTDPALSTETKSTYNLYFRGRYCYVLRMRFIVLLKPDEGEYRYYRLIKSPNSEIYNYKEFSTNSLSDVLREEGLTESDIVDKTEVDINPTASSPKVIRVYVNGITQDQYHTLEDNDAIKSWLTQNNIMYLLYRDFKNYYIDKKNSPTFGNIDHYLYHNSQLMNTKNISTDMLRIYRSKVAGFIDAGNTSEILDYCTKKTELIKYYKNNMANATTDSLSMMQNNNSSSTSSKSTCSCGCTSSTSTGLSTLSLNTTTCNLLKEYRKVMKNYMIELFSDIEFWKDISTKYKVCLDNIIDYTKALKGSGLSIFTNDKNLDLNYDCSSISSNDELYIKFLKDLDDIITAFELIMNEDYSRKSFINVTLAKFADMYEYMQWDGYVVNLYDENWE